ncbi:uncharacterized protein LOC111330491 [Stylophora pistillata]|uniref:uncharacterized protein LOC111330491 n=1 Tax=Stylophora pistillata TaxID=50429 RepID=UPI000C045B96|nr:uncharacterized protein LOC111330491 [Stylophora pistillata]
MRERNILPFLGEKMNDYKKSSQGIKVLDSIPESDIGASSRLPRFCYNKSVSECKKQGLEHKTEKWSKSPSNGVNLPKLENRSPAAPHLERTIGSPNPTGFLNVANIPFSPRENTGDKFKKEPGINCEDYVMYEPACTAANLATTNIELSRYAFRSSLERIPETDGERFLSAHSKEKLHSADVENKEPNTSERKTSKRRETQPSSLKNVDLFHQQRQHLWEVHEQPKINKALQSRKYPKRLPLLHKIPTAPQDNQPIDGDDKADENDTKIPQSPLSKIPHPPPPTPRSQTCPPSSSGNIADK